MAFPTVVLCLQAWKHISANLDNLNPGRVASMDTKLLTRYLRWIPRRPFAQSVPISRIHSHPNCLGYLSNPHLPGSLINRPLNLLLIEKLHFLAFRINRSRHEIKSLQIKHQHKFKPAGMQRFSTFVFPGCSLARNCCRVTKLCCNCDLIPCSYSE